MTSTMPCRPLRPGGTALTETLVSKAELQSGASILDVGCGLGDSVAYLQDKHGLNVLGIDNNPDHIHAARERHPHCHFVQADIEAFLPPIAAYDAILAECTLSLLTEDATLLTMAASLRPNGLLLLSDVYHRDTTAISMACPTGALRRLHTKDGYCARLTAASFTVQTFEDCSTVLGQYFGQMIFDLGYEEALAALGIAEPCAKEIGYMFCIAKKQGSAS